MKRRMGNKLFGILFVVALSLSLMGAGQYGGTWKRTTGTGGAIKIEPHDDVEEVSFGTASTIISVGDATTLEGEAGSYYLDGANATGTFPVATHSASLEYEDPAGFFEDYTTADIFYKWQNNIATAASFGNVSASLSDGSITILAGGDGSYQISRNTGMHGEPEVGYSFDIFKNGTSISASHTSPGSPNSVDPFFTNLSSFGQDATYGVNSSIDFLFHADKDQIDIVEGGTGNGADEWCFEYEMHFNIAHLPHVLFLGNIQYVGGAGHFADALAFNNLSSRWDDLRVATGDIVNSGIEQDYKNENIAFAFPNDGRQDRYVLNGLVKTKLRHNGSVVCSSSHTLYVDKAAVEDLLGARSDSSYIVRDLVAGDKITVQEKPDIANKDFHRHKTILNVTRIGN